VGLVLCLLTLVVESGVSLRGAPRVLEVVRVKLGLTAVLPAVPDWTTGRNWLLRIGLYLLTRSKEVGDDWVWFVDHSCQMGPEKCLVILGLRLRDLPPAGVCVRLEDLEPLEVLPVRSSTAADVNVQLEAVAARTGVPRVIVRDDGSDLRGGVALFRERHPETADVYDSKHKVACVLRHLLEADERWAAFVGQVGRTKCQVQQTELAFLAPPTLRTKARYMNLAEVVAWGSATLRLVDAPPAEVLAHTSVERLGTKLGWLATYREALAEWSELLAVARVAEDFLRRQGLYAGAAAELAAQLPHPEHLSAMTLRQELLAHVRGQVAQVRPGERLPASTEALESSFGRFKQLEKEHSRGGFTGLLLGFGALLGHVTAEVVQAGLESCPLKQVWSWCKEKLGPSICAQRRLAYAAPPAQ
jgi:hypothetical protein